MNDDDRCSILTKKMDSTKIYYKYYSYMYMLKAHITYNNRNFPF